jgi:hypothetical protein
VEPTVPQLAAVLPSDDAKTLSATEILPQTPDLLPAPSSPSPAIVLPAATDPSPGQSDAVLQAQYEAATYPSPMPEPDSNLINSHTLNPSFASNLGQHAEPPVGPFGPGIFWNPWVGGVGNAQHSIGQFRVRPDMYHRLTNYTATENLDASSAQVETTAAVNHTRHCLPSGQPYVRTVSEERVIYHHPTAGQNYGKGQTQWEVEREKNAVLRGGNEWAMWKDQDEWETVKWMATTKVSQSSLNKLLKTERVSVL